MQRKLLRKLKFLVASLSALLLMSGVNRQLYCAPLCRTCECSNRSRNCKDSYADSELEMKWMEEDSLARRSFGVACRMRKLKFRCNLPCCNRFCYDYHNWSNSCIPRSPYPNHYPQFRRFPLASYNGDRLYVFELAFPPPANPKRNRCFSSSFFGADTYSRGGRPCDSDEGFRQIQQKAACPSPLNPYETKERKKFIVKTLLRHKIRISVVQIATSKKKGKGK